MTALSLLISALLMSCFSLLQAEDVNRTLEGGRKPLHYAADFGQTEVVEFLISKGADVNVRATTASSHHFLFASVCLPSRVAVTMTNNSAFVCFPSTSKPTVKLLDLA